MCANREELWQTAQMTEKLTGEEYRRKIWKNLKLYEHWTVSRESDQVIVRMSSLTYAVHNWRLGEGRRPGRSEHTATAISILRVFAICNINEKERRV